QGGFGLADLRTRRIARVGLGIEFILADETAFEQGPVAFIFGFGELECSARRGQTGAGAGARQVEIPWIELRDHLVPGDVRSGIDMARTDLAGDTEAQGAFVA